MRKRIHLGALLMIPAALLFTATAVAGNGHGGASGQEKASVHATVHGSAHASVHAQAHAAATLHSHGATKAAGHAKSSTQAHATTHTGTQASVSTGVKSSSETGFNTSASASSNQTKLYGNGMTAGQIATNGGAGSAMLFGPGNSQAHLVLCGNRMFDVHALKAHLGLCGATAGVTIRGKGRSMLRFGASTQTQASPSAGLKAGTKTSSKTGFNAVVSASSNQTKLYGNGMTAGQIAMQGGLGGTLLFGPGSSQAHLVLCGNRMFDVHALKAHAGACATASAGTGITATTSSTTTGATATAHGSTTSKTGAAVQTGTNVAAGTHGNASTGAQGTASTGTSTSTNGNVLGATAKVSSTGSGSNGGVLGATTSSGNLPFTGLALGVPLGIALMLLISGLGIRRAARS